MRCRSHPDAIAAGKRASTLRHALVDALSSAATASCLSLGRVFRDLWPARVTVPSLSALRFHLALAPTLHQPEGSGHRSRAPPAASGPSVCPSLGFRAS